jgi:hypothetical protein
VKRFGHLIFVTVLAACAQLGTPPVDTFNKRVAVAYATVQTVAEGATAAYTAGKLSDSDRTNVVTTGRAAVQGIMVAQTLHLQACPLRPQIETPDPACTAPAADAKLTATLAVLSALQAYLATQGVK